MGIYRQSGPLLQKAERPKNASELPLDFVVVFELHSLIGLGIEGAAAQTRHSDFYVVASAVVKREVSVI